MCNQNKGHYLLRLWVQVELESLVGQVDPVVAVSVASTPTADASGSNIMTVSVLLASDKRALTATKTMMDGDDVSDVRVKHAIARRPLDPYAKSSEPIPPSVPLDSEDASQDEGDIDPFTDPFTMDYEAGDVPSIITDIPTYEDLSSIPPSPTSSDFLSSAASSVPPSPAGSQMSLPSFRCSGPTEVEQDSDCSESPAVKKRRTTYGVVGISPSAQASQKLKTEMQNDTLVKNDKRLNTYQEACRIYDRYAKFEYGPQWKVWHSVCGKWYAQKEAYSTTRFTTHAEECTQRRVDLALAKRKESGEKVNRGDVTVARHGSLDGWVKRSKTTVIKVVTETGMLENSHLNAVC